jgi:hypothetical protein
LLVEKDFGATTTKSASDFSEEKKEHIKRIKVIPVALKSIRSFTRPPI